MATARFSESTRSVIGIRTRWSATASTAGVNPSPSDPTSGAQAHDRRRPVVVACAGKRHVQRRTHGRADLYREQVTVVDFTGASPVERHATGVDSIRSSVLPALESSAFGIFS